jgi:hypothetical protein
MSSPNKKKDERAKWPKNNRTVPLAAQKRKRAERQVDAHGKQKIADLADSFGARCLPQSPGRKGRMQIGKKFTTTPSLKIIMKSPNVIAPSRAWMSGGYPGNARNRPKIGVAIVT